MCDELRDQLDNVTRLLRLACRVFEARADVPMPSDVHVWWQKERAIERERERKIDRSEADEQVLRQRALNKIARVLSPGERRALGV
jgi:hypothetical protein